MSRQSRVPNPESAPLIFIALGSNLGDSRSLVLSAMDRLQGMSDQPLRRSSLWNTTPVDCPPGSPPFINAVIGLAARPGDTPEGWLDRLQLLERELGRQPKKVLNEARPLDLDLISFGSVVLKTERLILPHPRAHLRRFVLAPLAEIAPDLVLPGQSLTVRKLLAALDSAEVVQRER